MERLIVVVLILEKICQVVARPLVKQGTGMMTSQFSVERGWAMQSGLAIYMVIVFWLVLFLIVGKKMWRKRTNKKIRIKI